MDIKDLTFHDATIKPSYARDLAMSSGPVEPYCPSISFSEDALPEIKDWKVGEEYVVVLKVKQTSEHIHEVAGVEKHQASFDILEVAGFAEDKKKSSEREL